MENRVFPINSVSPEKFKEDTVEFLLRRKDYQKQLHLLLKKKDESVPYGFKITFIEFHSEMQVNAMLLLNYPGYYVSLLDEAIVETQQRYLELFPNKLEDMSIKLNVHARVERLPLIENYWMELIPKTSQINKFIELACVTVIRTGLVKSLEWEKTFECVGCKYQFSVYSDIEERNAFPKILKCPSQREKPCMSHNFVPIENSEKCRDYQEIKIQEPIGKLQLGNIPRSLIAILTDDLVDCCQAGEEIRVSGILKRRWRYLVEEQRCDVELILEVNSISSIREEKFGVNVTDDQIINFRNFWDLHADKPLVGRDTILRGVCPNLYGLYYVKLALMLALIGGVQRTNSTGSKVRGESHLLLVGEPGTGKSQFLKFAARLAQRAVLTTGVGTTSAGLTVTAVQESGGEWMLEAGALVLADGGVCCIDEFSSIRERDRATIHEAMEQQTLSVAKAGIICKLQTRTTVIAATNPKGKYDFSSSISVNTALASPLLSRFDLILILVDNQNIEWDQKVSSFILQGRSKDEINLGEYWPFEKLQIYVSYVKTINPILTNESKEILRAYYQRQRMADLQNQARTTIRLLESLIRLSQAHARLMFRDKVLKQDAIVAILLMEASMLSSALIGLSSTLHSVFPDNVEEDYKKYEKQILSLLGLEHLMTEEWTTISSASQGEPKNEESKNNISPSTTKSTPFTQKGYDELYEKENEEDLWGEEKTEEEESSLINQRISSGLKRKIPPSQNSDEEPVSKSQKTMNADEENFSQLSQLSLFERFKNAHSSNPQAKNSNQISTFQTNKVSQSSLSPSQTKKNSQTKKMFESSPPSSQSNKITPTSSKFFQSSSSSQSNQVVQNLSSQSNKVSHTSSQSNKISPPPSQSNQVVQNLSSQSNKISHTPSQSNQVVQNLSSQSNKVSHTPSSSSQSNKISQSSPQTETQPLSFNPKDKDPSVISLSQFSYAPTKNIITTSNVQNNEINKSQSHTSSQPLSTSKGPLLSQASSQTLSSQINKPPFIPVPKAIEEEEDFELEDEKEENQVNEPYELGSWSNTSLFVPGLGNRNTPSNNSQPSSNNVISKFLPKETLEIDLNNAPDLSNSNFSSSIQNPKKKKFLLEDE